MKKLDLHHKLDKKCLKIYCFTQLNILQNYILITTLAGFFVIRNILKRLIFKYLEGIKSYMLLKLTETSMLE